MKQIVIAIAALSVAVSAFAQGTVNFSNRTGAINAPFKDAGGANVGSSYWGQLLAGAPGSVLQPIGSPVPFRDGAGLGYITGGGSLQIPGVAGGSPADVQMVAWFSTHGATYAAAQASGLGGLGGSAVFSVVTGGSGTPPSLPANLTGLGTTAVTLSAIVPEPSIAALGLLGAGLLLIRRKK